MSAPAASEVTQSVAQLSIKDGVAPVAATASASSSSSDSKENKEQTTTNGDADAESSDDEEDGAAGGAASGDAEKKKKKKKKNKKKKAAPPAANACGVHLFCQGGRTPSANPPVLNANKAVKHRQQVSPVTIPIADLFQNHIYPEGEVMQYQQDFNTYRIGSEEKRAAERQYDEILNDIREAAEVHRQVRADFQRWVKPGMTMIDIAQYIERGTRAGLKAEKNENWQKRGWGFPTGVSLNHCAAHYTPNYKDTTVLREMDVMKVDFGTQINGHIVDSAFTVAFHEKYDPLLNAVKEATNAGLKFAGIDVRLGDVGGAIQEVMESHEIELNGTTYPIKCIRNLNGHSIGPYRIHYGKSIPIYDNKDATKLEEGEFYAIETFGTTGRGHVVEDMECSHYMKSADEEFKPLRTKAAKDLLRHIDSHHGTLAFCRRWLEDDGCKGYLGGLKELVDNNVVLACPPLLDVKGSYTAQFEHTFLLRPTCKEIISRGEDY